MRVYALCLLLGILWWVGVILVVTRTFHHW
jgi:hypothetical protein